MQTADKVHQVQIKAWSVHISLLIQKRLLLFLQEKAILWTKDSYFSWKQQRLVSGKHAAFHLTRHYSNMTYDQVWWLILEICALYLTHSQYTPGAVGSHLCCGARGAVGVWCLAQGHLSRGIEVERALYIHSPHLQFLLDLRLELATFWLRVRLSNQATTFPLTDGLDITCGLFWCFYQLIKLSFWWHPFTAEDPLVSKWWVFLQICSQTK